MRYSLSVRAGYCVTAYWRSDRGACTIDQCAAARRQERSYSMHALVADNGTGGRGCCNYAWLGGFVCASAVRVRINRHSSLQARRASTVQHAARGLRAHPWGVVNTVRALLRTDVGIFWVNFGPLLRFCECAGLPPGPVPVRTDRQGDIRPLEPRGLDKRSALEVRYYFHHTHAATAHYVCCSLSRLRFDTCPRSCPRPVSLQPTSASERGIIWALAPSCRLVR